MIKLIAFGGPMDGQELEASDETKTLTISTEKGSFTYRRYKTTEYEFWGCDTVEV